jgi:hypothetical protein
VRRFLGDAISRRQLRDWARSSPRAGGGQMGITIQGTPAVSRVTIAVTRAYDAKHDDGPVRRRVKDSALKFLTMVVGTPVNVTHGLAGERGNRSVWTLEADMGNLANVAGKERRSILATLKKSAASWAVKNVGNGARVALTVADADYPSSAATTPETKRRSAAGAKRSKGAKA